jgi:hypothetical protein
VRTVVDHAHATYARGTDAGAALALGVLAPVLPLFGRPTLPSAVRFEGAMATIALIHGDGDVGWYWQRAELMLRQSCRV